MTTDTITSFPFIKGLEDRPNPDRHAYHDWYRQWRAARWQAFVSAGWPTTRDEDWKYTDLSSLRDTAVAAPGEDSVLDAGFLRTLIDPREISVVFFNGRYQPALSSDLTGITGLRIQSLAEAMAAGDEALRALITATAEDPAQPFALLNEALAGEGLWIDLAPRVVAQPLLHIIYVNQPGEPPPLTMPRVIIRAGQGSELSVMESHLFQPGDGSYVVNALTDILVEDEAAVRYCRLGHDHPSAWQIATTRVRQQRGARFAGFALQTGSRLTRSNVTVDLEQEGAEAELDGLYVPRGNQHVDNHTRIRHLAPHCHSSQIYKGVLYDAARAVFHGRVYVHPEAQRTDAYQLNRNLLMGMDCRIDTKPQLEIFADDVKCSHGAAIGQLNDDEVFYLRSRGLDQAAAEQMLAQGFVDDVLNRIADPAVRARLTQILQPILLAAGRKE